MAVSDDVSDGTGTPISTRAVALGDFNPLGTLGLKLDTQTEAGDTDYTILPIDRYVVTSVVLTLPRTWTLPLAASVSVGWTLTVADSAGVIGASESVTVSPQGSDTINGVATTTSFISSYDYVVLRSDGASNWTVIGASPTMLLNGVALDVAANDLGVSGVPYLGGLDLALVNGRNDNVAAVSTGYWRTAGPSATYSISGIVRNASLLGEDGQLLIIENNTAHPMGFLHESAFSTAANRVYSPTGVTVTVQAGGCALLVYDGLLGRWVIVNAWDGNTTQGGVWSSNAPFGLDFIGTEFNGGTSSLDTRSTEGPSLAAPSHTLSGTKMGAWHIGGSTDSTLVDVAFIACEATQDFSGTQHGNKWVFYVTPNGTTVDTLALTIGQDLSLTVAGALSIGSALTVPNGGTGRAALTDHYLLIGDGTAALTMLAPGTSGLPLLSQGASADPAYAALDISTAAATGTLTVAKGGTGNTAYTGWTTDTNTWTYASATTFTVAGVDVTAQLKKGTRLRLVNNSVTKYFVVVGSVFSTDTTVTVTGGTDYTLVTTGGITAPSFSYELTPQGYPGWFNYTPTFTGYSADPTSLAYQFRVDGTMCTYIPRDGADGTSNGTGLTMTIPVTAVTLTNGHWSGYCRIRDNSANVVTPGLLTILSAGTVVAASKDWAAAVFTNTGAKRVVAGTIIYPI